MPGITRLAGRVLLCALVAMLVIGLTDESRIAAGPDSERPVTSTSEDRLLPSISDVGELEAFIDPIFAEHMDEYDIPGAAFALVSDGQVVLSKGYGYADRENQVPVDPDQTIFDLGSIGKLFTATAVMQLVEQGLIDLHTDINEYLTTVEIPDTFDEPITVHHLLTHTTGFDDRFYFLGIAPGPDEITPLSEYVRTSLPPRVRPPGQTFQYSNAGTTLAGRIIEEVTGQRFEEYVTEHIIEPLGMERSTYGLPEDLVPDMAMGYEGFPETTFSPHESWHLNGRPAAGVRATANDMTAFMQAHLNDGGFNGARILEPETVELMHQTQFTPHRDVSGMAYGFWEHQAGDRRGIHHGGQWVGFSNLLYLVPDENLGIIVSYNHGSAIFVQSDLIEAILERYYPVEPIDGAETNAGTASQVTGQYRSTRTDNHTFLRFPSVITSQTLSVTSNDDDTIEVSMSPSFIPDGTWVELEPGIFGELGGDNVMAFHLDDENADRVHVGWPLLMTMERIAWYQSAGLHLLLLVGFLVVIASTIAWPVGRLYRRIRGRSFAFTPILARARLLGGVIAGLIFAFLFGLLISVLGNIEGLAQIPTTLKAMLWLPIIAAVLTLPLIYFVIQLWLNRDGPTVSRVHLTILTIALVGLFPFMYYWNLLGFHY